MAGQNICNILQSHIKSQERPDYLHPRDEKGGFPWKEGYEDQEMSESAVPGANHKQRPEEDDDTSENEKTTGMEGETTMDMEID